MNDEYQDKKIYTVLELNQKLKSLVESDFSFIGILVKGEITSLNKHYTGHYYFKLRDEDGALISCVMFQSYTKFAPSDLKNGDEVILHGSLQIYDKGGTYNFLARKIEPYGMGSYLLELKKLEEKLAKEGLFSKEKRKIPLFPKHIGIVTAKTGAAIHDVTSSILKNCPTEISIFPCLVQGDEAPKSMIKALKKAYEYPLDVLILTRGGGSKDDLYAFNDEELIRTLSASPFPTITAVGHSIDTSLVDKVSDLICITPTEAGSKVMPSKEILLKYINDPFNKAKILLENKLKDKQNELMELIHRLEISSLSYRFNEYKNRLNLLKQKMDHLILNKINKLQHLLSIHSKITPLTKRIELYKYRLNTLKENEDKAIYLALKRKYNLLLELNKRSETFSPFSLLSKGYVMMYNKDNQIITSKDQIQVDEELHLELKDAYVDTKVINIKEKKHGKN